MSAPSTRAPSPATSQHDAELLAEAKKSKLFDMGSRLRHLKGLASSEGKEAAKAAASSDVAKKILASGGKRRRHTKKRRHLKRKTHRRR